MELTRERAIEEHRKMWRWLAEHPEKKKWDYLLDETPILNDLINIRNMCFLCTYTKEKCNCCPLDWGAACCCKDDGLIARWNNARSIREKATFAKQIAELPERELVNANIKMPKKITDVTYTDDNTSELDYAAGRNACIDAITGGINKNE